MTVCIEHSSCSTLDCTAISSWEPCQVSYVKKQGGCGTYSF